SGAPRDLHSFPTRRSSDLWRSLLGAAIRSATASSGAGDDYTYRRPARRSAAVPGAVLPSLRRTPPRVGVIVDTSGSVSDADLGRSEEHTSELQSRENLVCR